MPDKRSFPGRLTLEQWRATPAKTRLRLVRQAQCDLLGSFRFCANKRCRRGRTCVADDAVHQCWDRVRRAGKKNLERRPWPKAEREEWARLHRLW